MNPRQLHRNAVPFCLALMSACWFWGGGTAVAQGAASQYAQVDATAEAERLLQEGERLSRAGTPESLQQALQAWERASALFREVGNPQQEATALGNMAAVCDTLGERQKAIEYYDRALPLYRTAGDLRGEATMLNNIAAIYSVLGEKQKAIDYYDRALPLYRTASDLRGEVTALNNIGTVYSALGERQKALDYFNRALPLAKDDRSGEATALNNIGELYYDLGELRKALDYFERALTLREALSDRAEEAITLSNLGAVYDALAEQPKALDYLARALALFRAIEDRRGEATTLNNIGAVYRTLGEKQKALDYLNQALPLRRAIGDRRGEAYTLTHLGAIFNAMGDRQKALEHYTSALSLFRAVGDRSGEAMALTSLGAVYDALGEKQQALDAYNQALPPLQAAGNRRGEANTLNNIAAVYSSLGEKERALEDYDRALSLFRAVEDRSGAATTLNNLGSVYLALGENQKALDYFNQALPLHQAARNRRGEANALVQIGAVYDALKERQKALDYAERALALYRTLGAIAGEATALNNIGGIYDQSGEKQKALDYYDRALTLYRSIGDRNGEATILNNLGIADNTLGSTEKALENYNRALPLYRAIGNRGGEARTLYNVAQLYRQQNQLSQALSAIDGAIALVEDLRTKIENTTLRTVYFATVQHYYKLKTDLLMQRGQPQAAFNTNERSRARTFLELLNRARLDLQNGADSPLIERERQLRQQLQALETRRADLLSGNSPENPATLLATLDRESDTALSELEQLLSQIRRSNPAYADLKQPEPLTLSQIQQQVLDSETVLLQYSLNKERSYLWVVSQNDFQHYTLPGIEELAKPLEQFQSAIARSGTSETQVLQKGRAIARVILPEPVWANIAGKRLLIVGEGGLETIPFAALPVPSAPQYTPLLAQNEVLTQPSISALAILRQQTLGRNPAPKTLAILADPVYTADDPRVTNRRSTPLPGELDRTLRSLERASLNRLPNTRREAEQILALLPPTERNAVFDFAADRDWSIAPQLSQYRILHFATHGFINPVNPELSGLVLSLVNSSGLPQPGYLRLNDIFNLNLPAELVVLSACQTGLGENINGEGLIGLTRGFMYAGTKRLVVSLWNVDDAATADLMVSMYGKIFQEKMTPAAALRAAQLEMWKAGKKTNYWAAFTVRGEWKKNE